MTTRISGLSSGLDTDSIIKETMKAYQTKVDKKKQERDVTQAQQDQYRELVKASQDFFDKYFDITKSDSLLREGSYKTVSFSAGDGSDSATNNAPVTAKGLAGAAVDNYTVDVKALAQPAKQQFTKEQLEKISTIGLTINGQNVTISRGTKSADDFMSTINSTVNSLGMKMTYSQFDQKYTLSTNATGTTTKFDMKIGSGTANLQGVTLNPDGSFSIGNGSVSVDGTGTLSVAAGGTVTQNPDGSATAKDGAGNYITKYKDGSIISKDVSGNYITKSADGGILAIDAAGNANSSSPTGQDAQVSITNSKGQTYTPTDLHSNTVTVDDVQFNFNGITTSGSPVNLTGRTDVKDLKDRIVKFVDDYNTLIGKFNTKIYETRNKNYMPLTDDQKAAMSDKQIEAWEKKATTGLLRRDSDLQRITQGMKSAMAATDGLLKASGLSLEKIGIEPVRNYTDKNGTYKVNGDKLEEALKTNADQIKTMFIKLPSSDKADDGGILQKLKKVLDDETRNSGSVLSKKVGFEGTATYLDNTLTKQLKEEQKKIDEMTKSLSDREQKLYSKYSKLETAMNSLNSQQSWFSQQMGQ